VLVFVGTKMIVAPWVKVPPAVSLSVIGGILALAVGASLWRSRARAVPPVPAPPPAPEGRRAA
jgi:tellurite resistance protein TerC